MQVGDLVKDILPGNPIGIIIEVGHIPKTVTRGIYIAWDNGDKMWINEKTCKFYEVISATK